MGSPGAVPFCPPSFLSLLVLYICSPFTFYLCCTCCSRNPQPSCFFVFGRAPFFPSTSACILHAFLTLAPTYPRTHAPCNPLQDQFYHHHRAAQSSSENTNTHYFTPPSRLTSRSLTLNSSKLQEKYIITSTTFRKPILPTINRNTHGHTNTNVGSTLTK